MSATPPRRFWMWRHSGLPLAILVMVLQGCATLADPSRPTHPSDPWEGWNRKVFSFNEGLDEAVVKPVATTYVKVVPQLARQGVTNFFGNFSDAWSAVNSFLQGKGEAGFSDLMRVSTNTVFGIFGLFDVASEAGIERHGEDFGQTLGVWGVPAGPYMMLPLLGPSSLRETAALPLNMSVGPGALIREDGVQWGVTVLQVVNLRANLLSTTGLLDDIALDRYVFVRDAYLQRRRSLVYGGDPPELPPEPEAPSDAASKP